MNENTIKLKHPQFGLVTFSGMTLRQMDVLREYEKLQDNIKDKKQRQQYEPNKKNKAIMDAEIRISSPNRRY